jgi:hypothetical protein
VIFAKTWRQILDRTKTQTLRLAYRGDHLSLRSPGEGLAVWTIDGRCRWMVGRTYAIQPERCHFAVGRIRCTYLKDIANPMTVLDDAFARAEGMPSVDEFLRVWRELHQSQPRQRCWAIGFELV